MTECSDVDESSRVVAKNAGPPIAAVFRSGFRRGTGGVRLGARGVAGLVAVKMRINIPNQITLGRLVLAVVFFALLSWFRADKLSDSDGAGGQRLILQVCFWVFLVAALADYLDGFLARMLKQVTSFGRIVDPVVDKVMICGAFAYFGGPIFWDGTEHANISGVRPWMVVLILVRELLVSAIRSHSESQGRDFAATWVGKVKMVVQSTTVCVILGVLGFNLPNFDPLRIACVWLTVIITALSIVSYVRRAHAFLLSSEALGGSQPTAGPDTGRLEDSEVAPPPSESGKGAAS